MGEIHPCCRRSKGRLLERIFVMSGQDETFVDSSMVEQRQPQLEFCAQLRTRRLNAEGVDRI